MSEEMVIIATCGLIVAWCVIEFFRSRWLARQFSETRHLLRGVLLHRDQRIKRIEDFLERKCGFDPASDLPLAGEWGTEPKRY